MIKCDCVTWIKNAHFLITEHGCEEFRHCPWCGGGLKSNRKASDEKGGE
jgi:hypothetical protein